MSQRPNILFVQVDSMDGRAMGCMGHPSLTGATPNIDRLAAEGVLFENAYTNCPICCPSRSSMWSGLHTHRCEAWNNYKGLSRTTPTFVDALNRAGYRTKLTGDTDHLSGGHTQRARVSAWTRSASIMRPNYRMGPPEVIESDEARVHAHDWQSTDAAAAWLREEAASAPGPFFLYLGVNVPHPEFRISQHYLDLIDESRVELPPVDESPHPVLVYQRVNKNWTYGFADETVRLVRRIYFAMVAEADAMVGQMLRALDESGLANSTCVFFLSDHGELAMEHRQFFKMSMYEASARVPLIIRPAGGRPGVRVRRPVSLIDVYPTLMELAGARPMNALDGHSLAADLAGAPSAHPGLVLSQFHDSTCNTGSFMLREGDWKYIAYVGHAPQLFNVEQDPCELSDLAAAKPRKVREMDARLRGLLDYEAVDRKVKAYDRGSFSRWRTEHLAAGDYRKLMSLIFSGWDYLAEDECQPWTVADERLIEAWLRAGEKR